MKRFGLTGLAAAIVTVALGGSAPEAQAAEMLQAGFAYGGWGGPMGAGFGGYGVPMGGGWGYGGPALAYAGYNGGMGGYVSGGGWGYTGSCCNNVWAGYCGEQGCRRGCRIKHRHRALGCGAGPCCQPTCETPVCDTPACGTPACGNACAAPAPCGRRHFCGRFRRACGMICGMGTGCYADNCCGGAMGPMDYGYDGGTAPAAYDDREPASPSDAPAPMPEEIEQPAPEKSASSST